MRLVLPGAGSPKKTLVNFRNEYRLFLSYPRDMRVLIVTNLVYGLVMPVVEMFIAAYIMRKSDDVKMVVTYQLSIYTGIPFTFLVNGWLLKLVGIKWLYSAGMLLSSVSMVVMMTLGKLSVAGLGITGVLMGMSFGLYWSNRDFVSLSSTNDSNRNYYYGLENFFATNLNIGVPLAVGTFIARFGGENAARVVLAYQIVTGIVFALTFVASVIVHQGRFQNPPATPFLYFRYHWLWNRMQLLAMLKGIGQGYTVTAPAMLVMTLVGKEGSLGTLLSAGGVLSAVGLYIVGRTAQPAHRIWLLAASWSLFALGALANAALFDSLGVLLFLLLLALGRPLADIAYFTIQMLVIDTVAAIEHRNKYSYIFSQEFGFYIGRVTGCGLFILLAYEISNTFALRYALLIIGLVQLLALPLASSIVKGCAADAAPTADNLAAAESPAAFIE
jgi:YQGE family putative transporter